jgi:hypothetical protein
MQPFDTNVGIGLGAFSGTAFVTRWLDWGETIPLGFRAPAFESGGVHITKRHCGGCLNLVVPVPAGGKGLEFLSVTFGTLTADNCNAPARAADLRRSPHAAMLPRGR